MSDLIQDGRNEPPLITQTQDFCLADSDSTEEDKDKIEPVNLASLHLTQDEYKKPMTQEMLDNLDVDEQDSWIRRRKHRDKLTK